MSPVKNGDIMKRLRKMMPKTVEPAFNSPEELLQWQREQGQLRSEALERENRAMKMQRTFNRSGIRPLHQNCSFDNYLVECEGQMKALMLARCQQRVKSDPLTVTTNGLILIHLVYSGLASAITPAFRFCFSR